MDIFMEKVEKMREFCYTIIDLCDFCKKIEELNTCNTCKAKHTCPMCPQPGETVRYNCYMYSDERFKDYSELSEEEKEEIKKNYLEDQLKRKL